MAMGLQYAVDVISTLPKNYCLMVALGSDIVDSTVDSKNLLSKEANIGFQHSQGSMDRMLEECSRGSIRNVMLKQEEIFKDQVSQLHHLYQVQKNLMAELSKDITRLHPVVTSGSNSLNFRSSPCIDRFNSVAQTNSTNDSHHVVDIAADPSKQGVCISPSESLKVQTGLDFGLPFSKDYITYVNSTTIQNKSPMVDGIGLKRAYLLVEDDCDLDLTLSIGNNKNRKKSRHEDKEKGRHDLTFEEARNQIPCNGVRSQQGKHGELTATFDAEGVQRPSWFFQTLSLNRTRTWH